MRNYAFNGSQADVTHNIKVLPFLCPHFLLEMIAAATYKATSSVSLNMSLFKLLLITLHRLQNNYLYI